MVSLGLHSEGPAPSGLRKTEAETFTGIDVPESPSFITMAVPAVFTSPKNNNKTRFSSEECYKSLVTPRFNLPRWSAAQNDNRPIFF